MGIEYLNEEQLQKIKNRKSKDGYSGASYERKAISERMEAKAIDKKKSINEEKKEDSSKKIIKEEDENLPAETSDMPTDVPAEEPMDSEESADDAGSEEPVDDAEFEGEVRDALAAYIASDEFKEKYGDEADSKAQELQDYLDGVLTDEEGEGEDMGDDMGGDEEIAPEEGGEDMSSDEEPVTESVVYGCLECNKKFESIEPVCPVCESDVSEFVLYRKPINESSACSCKDCKCAKGSECKDKSCKCCCASGKGSACGKGGYGKKKK